MSTSTINIGSRVFNVEYGWGYVKERKGDMLGVEFDRDSEFHLINKVYLFPSALTKETFLQYLFRRPGKVGAWSKVEYIAIQIALACVLGVSVATFNDGGWITAALAVGIEVIIHIGHYRNWQGKQM